MKPGAAGTPRCDESEIYIALDEDGIPHKLRGRFIPINLGRDIEREAAQLRADNAALAILLFNVLADIDESAKPISGLVDIARKALAAHAAKGA